MMKLELFKMTPEQKKIAIKKLIESSSPTQGFFLVLILSTIIVTVGILLNSVGIVIGGMLVTPMLSPILAISLGIVMADYKMIKRSFMVLFKSIGWVIVISVVIALFVIDKQLNYEIISRTKPDLLYFIIALASGIAASFAISKQEFSERMVGVAVAIALLPPLAVIGIGISFWKFSIVAGSIGLFLANLAGILLGSLIVFSLLRFYPEKQKVHEELKQEEKVLEEEK